MRYTTVFWDFLMKIETLQDLILDNPVILNQKKDRNKLVNTLSGAGYLKERIQIYGTNKGDSIYFNDDYHAKVIGEEQEKVKDRLSKFLLASSKIHGKRYLDKPY